MPQEVRDDDWLLRRIPPWHVPVQDEADGGRQRPPSSAYALEAEEEGLSFHVERWLRDAGEPLTYGCPDGVPGWAVARVPVAAVKQLGFDILPDGIPYHVQVRGLAQLGTSKRRKAQQQIARQSVYVVPPVAT